jgi:hypothetical protein
MIIKTPDKPWLTYLQKSYNALLKTKPIPFCKIIPSIIPDVGGVYLITANIQGLEVPYYVGRSKRLRRRIYTNHLMGSVKNARLKKYLINSTECQDV